MRTLSLRELNRATLGRQLLLRRGRLDPVKAVDHLAGLQAQEPASPFLALWARLDDFDPEALRAAITARRLVKATLMRSTLHLVSADDYRRLVPAVQPTLRTKWMPGPRGRPQEMTLDTIASRALAYAAQPRTNQEMRDFVADLGKPVEPLALWMRVRRHVPFIHVPNDDGPWAFGRRPAFIDAATWVDGAFATDEASADHVVRRYLGAYGPATMADIAAWSGMAVGLLRPVVERIDGVRRFHDEDGRRLVDLQDAPLPDADTPAPIRFLPMWDSALLAYADRRRILPEEYRKAVIARNGDVAPTVLVDGSVAGIWWAESDGSRTRIVVEPFAGLPRSTARALEDEAERLAAFVGPLEPRVYSRYRTSRARAVVIAGG